MFCKDCKFHQGGYMWNRCALTDAEYYREYNEEPCPIVNDDYIFTEYCEPLGFVEGESAIEFMKGGAE